MNVFFHILDLIIITALLWTIYHFSKRILSKQLFLLTAGLKIFAGIVLGLLYLYYYKEGDTFNYFNYGNELNIIFVKDIEAYLKIIFLNSTWENMPYIQEPRALFMVKAVSLVNLFTYNNYWWTSTFLSLFCFGGLFSLAGALHHLFPVKKFSILVSLLFFPSVVFWSSGIMKETIAIGAMGFVITSFLTHVFSGGKYRLWDFLRDIVMLWLLWNIKYYYCGLLLLVLFSIVVTWVIDNRFLKGRTPPLWTVVVFILSGIIMLFAISWLHPNFQLNRVAEVMVSNYEKYVEISDPGDVIHFNTLEPDLVNLAWHAPKAFFSGLFRPLPGDGNDLLKIIAEGENLILLILAASALFKLPGPLSTRDRLLVLGGLGYCAVMATFLAFSAPNFGTLVRYKVGFLPVFLLLISMNNPLFYRLEKLIMND